MAETYKTIAEISQHVKTVAIPDKTCELAGINVAWAGEHKLGVHAFAGEHSKGTDRKSRYAPCVDKVFDLRTSSVLFHPITRKLVAESNGYFIFAQSLAKKSRSADYHLEVLKLSRLYRSILRICLEGFQSESETCLPKEKSQYLQHIPTFYNMELVWHLCEILFIDVLPGHLVLSPLISWIRFHVPHVENEAQKLLAIGDASVTKKDSYWLVIIDCLLQRRIETTRTLLSLHPKANTEPFKLMDQLLRTMPIFEVYSGLSATEFQVQHDCWKKEAMRLQRTGVFKGQDKYLDIISKIIIGDDAVQDVVKRHCETWYQYLVATLIYMSPSTKIFDLAFHANRSITIYGGPDHINQLDWILCAIMEMDIYKMVKFALEWPDAIWLLTHLVHLLQLLDKLNVSGSASDGDQLYESILSDYGCLLMSHSALWQIGVDYLDHCSGEGRGLLEGMLVRVPFHSNQKALKIVQIAKERGLTEVVYTVSKVLGLRSRDRGHLGSALTWAIRSQDPVFCSQLADIFLKDYVLSNNFQALDLLESLGCEMMLGDRLVFLGKYCEFCRLKKSGELKEASALLVLLLKNRVAPKYFWLTMFKDALSLLESDQPVMASADVFDLMTFFQELFENIDELKLENVENQFERIQTALSKSLAHALVTEGSGTVSA